MSNPVSSIVLENGRKIRVYDGNLVKVQECTSCGYSELESEEKPVFDKGGSASCPDCGENTGSITHTLQKVIDSE